MCPRQRLLVGVMLALFSFLYSPFLAFASSEETYFIATAYYSPLPNQSHYITGSYAWDIRLNGSGKITASGKTVFPWLLAGPKNYPFGTKIYFEGYGIGEIADRGWAIVKAGQRGHSYDRIDIWLGYGDAGLERAKRWGKRKIKWKIVVPSSKITLKIPESPLWVLTKLQVNPENSKEEDVKKLQTIFTKAKLYNGVIDGKYESIRKELIHFQIQNIDEINSSSHPHAGWYGKKTIAALRNKYPGSSDILMRENIELFHQFNHRVASEKYKIILEYGDLVVSPESEAEDIKNLQRLLRELQEYNGKIDGKYESIEWPLLALQKKIKLIVHDDDWGAGYFGNKTKTALWKYYETSDPSEKDTRTSVSQPSELKPSEKTRIYQAFTLIQKKFKREEQRGGKSAQYKLRQLKIQVEKYLPQVKDRELKLKLLYLQELLNS